VDWGGRPGSAEGFCGVVVGHCWGCEVVKRAVDGERSASAWLVFGIGMQGMNGHDSFGKNRNGTSVLRVSNTDGCSFGVSMRYSYTRRSLHRNSKRQAHQAYCQEKTPNSPLCAVNQKHNFFKKKGTSAPVPHSPFLCYPLKVPHSPDSAKPQAPSAPLGFSPSD
jgi:hypothetical protein